MGSAIIPAVKTLDLHNPSVRLLVLPDWQGAYTGYIRRVSKAFGLSLNAETIVLHPYSGDILPKRYGYDSRERVAKILRDRRKLRPWLLDRVVSLESKWEYREKPLVIIGFCFGGTLAFELARQSNIAICCASIHGDPATSIDLPALTTETPMVLAHGGDDPLIPNASITRFFREMQESDREWFGLVLGRARHSFTKEEVGTAGPGSVYSQYYLDAVLAALAPLIKQISTTHITSRKQGEPRESIA